MIIREGDAQQVRIEGEQENKNYNRDKYLIDIASKISTYVQFSSIESPLILRICEAYQAELNGIPTIAPAELGKALYRVAYNPDYANPWEKLNEATRRKYIAMALKAYELIG